MLILLCSKLEYKQTMKVLNEYCSDVVDGVFHLFVEKKEAVKKESLSDYPNMPSATRARILDYYQKTIFVQLFHDLDSLSQPLPRPFFASLEKQLAYLLDLQEEKKDDLEQFIQVKQRHQDKLKKLISSKAKADAIDFQQQFLQMHEEHGRVKFAELYSAEAELELCLNLFGEFKIQAQEKARNLNLPAFVGLELLSFALNTFFTTIHESHWNSFFDELPEKEQKLLKQFFVYRKKNELFELYLDLDYSSPLSGKQLLGEKSRHIGPPSGNYMIQRILFWKMKAFYLLDIKQEREHFFRFVTKEALKDGILTEEEIQQILGISKALGLEEQSACVLMNESALEVQQDLIYTALKAMFEMANAAEGIQKEEQLYILELKKSYQARMVQDMGQRFLQNPKSNLELCVTEEGIFKELVKLSLKGNEFGKAELALLKKYAKSMNWNEDKVKRLIAETKTVTNG